VRRGPGAPLLPCWTRSRSQNAARYREAGAFIPSRARSRYSPMCKTALAYDTRAGNGMPSAHNAGAVLYNGLRVVDDRGGTPGHCKNQPSDHGQLAGISKAHLARVFIPSRARGTDTLVRREPRISPEIPSSDVQNWVRTPRADRKRHAMCPTRQRPICTNDGESRRVAWSRERPCLAVQAYCKNLPSDHGQRAGISKLNPRRIPTRKEPTRTALGVIFDAAGLGIG